MCDYRIFYRFRKYTSYIFTKTIKLCRNFKIPSDPIIKLLIIWNVSTKATKRQGKANRPVFALDCCFVNWNSIGRRKGTITTRRKDHSLGEFKVSDSQCSRHLLISQFFYKVLKCTLKLMLHKLWNGWNG